MRRELGLPAVAPSPGLRRACEVQRAGFQHLADAAAHLCWAYRVTIGDAGAAYALERLREWVVDLTIEDLDALADRLVAEAADYAPRPTQ